MAQRPQLPRRPTLLKRYSESSLLHPSSLPRHVDHEEIVKLLVDIPSRQNLFNTSSTEGSTEAPSKYTRRFSELDYETSQIPSVYSVMSHSEDDLCTYRRIFDDEFPEIDYGHRSAPHGHVTPHHGRSAPPPELPRRVPRRSLTYHGVPKTHSKRFVRIRESRPKEETDAGTKDGDGDNKDNTTVHIPGEDEAVTYPPSGKDRTEETKDDKTAETDSIGSRGSSKAIKSGNGSIRRYRRRRKPKTLGDLPYHCEKQEDEAQLTKKGRDRGNRRTSQFSSIDDDEDTENLDQYAINQMLSHRYDDLAGVRRGSRTLHISRSPATPTRTLSASIRRSHKPHSEKQESQQQEVDITMDQEHNAEVAMATDTENEQEPLLGMAETEIKKDGERVEKSNDDHDDGQPSKCTPMDQGNEYNVAMATESTSEQEPLLGMAEVDDNMKDRDGSEKSEKEYDVPPSKFSRLADADGRQKYFARERKNKDYNEETDEVPNRKSNVVASDDNKQKPESMQKPKEQSKSQGGWMITNSDSEDQQQASGTTPDEEKPMPHFFLDESSHEEDNEPLISPTSKFTDGKREFGQRKKTLKAADGSDKKGNTSSSHDSEDEDDFVELDPNRREQQRIRAKEESQRGRKERKESIHSVQSVQSIQSNSSWVITTTSDESDDDADVDKSAPRLKFGSLGQKDVDMVPQQRLKFEKYKAMQKRAHSSSELDCSKNEPLKVVERHRGMSVPTIMGATLIELKDLAKEPTKLTRSVTFDDECTDDEPKRELTVTFSDDDKGSLIDRKLTFNEADDEDAGNSHRHSNGVTSPRRRRVGIVLDEGVDHSKLAEMMSEMGDFGEKVSSIPPNPVPQETDGTGIQPKQKKLWGSIRESVRGGSYKSGGTRRTAKRYQPLRQDAQQLPPAGSNDGGHERKSRKKSYANFDKNITIQSQLFVQLNELDRDDLGAQQSIILSKGASWKSRARWIKFEENWEEGANRWSKPHVASLTFNSLPQLRRGLENGLIMLDVVETSLQGIFNLLVDGLVRMELIEPEHQGAILRMLHLCGTGNKRQQERRGVSAVRRLSIITDMARHNSTDNNIPPNSPGSKSIQAFTMDSNCSNNAIYSSDEVHVSMLDNHEGVSQNNNNSQQQQHTAANEKHREGIMRKLPQDAEGAMVMVAMEDSLNGPVAALIRLVDPPVFDNFLEASIPLRFIFFLVGPDYSNVDYHEVGRAMSTLFSDDIFRDMAYAALDKQDLLNGINEFLNDTMVLPPGDWDRDLLLPITRNHKREQEKVMQRRKTISPLQMEKDAEAILKMSQDALNYADPLQRTGRIFGGLINDVKRRYPHYKSDFTDALNFQCVAAFVFIYFACLSPAITFGGLLGEKTDNWMGVSEMIVSTSLCGMLFALLSGQPLVMLGGTGPVLIFEEYLYKFCKEEEIDIDFMAFRTWIGFWIFVLAAVVVAFEGSVLVRYFTRFTEEIFSTLISVIFIYETYKGLKHIVCTNPLLPNYCLEEEYTVTSVINVSQWTSSTTESAYLYAAGGGGKDYPSHKETHSNGPYHTDPMQKDPYNCNVTQNDYTHKSKEDYECSVGDNPQPNTALFAIILTFGTFFISFFLRIFRSSRFLGRTARRALSNFGIAIAILIMVTLAYCLNHIYIDTIKITDGFHPTDPCKRGWLINPMGQNKRLPLGAVFGAIVPAFLVFILLYMETLLIGMVVNKECNKLRKGSGYHLDLFLIGGLSALAGLIGVPWMCAAPIRTVSHIGSLSVLTRTHAPGVKPKLDHIKDQRVTNFAVSFLIGLSNLMAPLLQEVPIAVLLGVFLYLGAVSLSGLQFIERLKIFFMPKKHHPDVRYIRMVKVWKMHMFTIIQVVCVLVLWVIKNSIIAMAFPFFLILLVIIRKILSFVFSECELEALDSEEEDEDDDRQVYEYDLG